MYLTHLGVEKAKSQLTKESSTSNTPFTRLGPNVKKEKLL